MLNGFRWPWHYLLMLAQLPHGLGLGGDRCDDAGRFRLFLDEGDLGACRARASCTTFEAGTLSAQVELAWGKCDRAHAREHSHPRAARVHTMFSISRSFALPLSRASLFLLFDDGFPAQHRRQRRARREAARRSSLWRPRCGAWAAPRPSKGPPRRRWAGGLTKGCRDLMHTPGLPPFPGIPGFRSLLQ